MKDPKRTLWQCTASVCVVGVYCWEISLWSADPLNLVSVLSIYSKIFLRVFIVYRLLAGFLYVWLYSAICTCVFVALVKLSVLAKWLAIERPIWWHLREVRRLSPQSPGGGACLCVFSFVLNSLSMLLCVSTSPKQYIFHMPMARNSLYVLKVPLNTKQTNSSTRLSSVQLSAADHVRCHCYRSWTSGQAVVHWPNLNTFVEEPCWPTSAVPCRPVQSLSGD